MTSALYAHVRVGDCDIAVPVSDLVQAIDAPATGPIPLPRRNGQHPGALAGLIEFEGSVVPLVALERWVPIGKAASAHAPRVLILRRDRSQIAIQVDMLSGVKRVPDAEIRTVCHDGSDDELFQAVAPAAGERPLLCVLDVARLMTLATAWCEEAELPDASTLAAASLRAVERRAAGSVRYVVLSIGNDVWAVPACAVSTLERTPRAEFRLAGRRVCGIGTWAERKVPLVDLGFDHDDAGTSRPWMTVVSQGQQAIGLLADRCERLVNIAADDVFPTAGDELRSGKTMVAGLGHVSLLDVDRLFAAIPEASISGVRRKADGQTATPRAVDQGEHTDYLVFDSDRAYAAPATGLIGVIKLTQTAIDDFAQGRRATVDWRSQTLGVVRMPQIDGGKAKFEPRLAVIVKGTQEGGGHRAVAVRSLTRWLPARSAQRSVMRIPSVGDVDVVTPAGADRSESLVVIDLAHMAYLLD